MGKPIEEPPVTGQPCDWCDGILWPYGNTPRFVKITFEGILPCPGAPHAMPNDEFVAEQDPMYACAWEYKDDKYWIHYGFDGVNTSIYCRSVVGGLLHYFQSFPLVVCESEFRNSYDRCVVGVNAGYDGTAVVEFEWENGTPKVVLAYERYLMLFDYGFLPVVDTMVDPAEITNQTHTYKFVNHELNTRILIKYDPAENEP